MDPRCVVLQAGDRLVMWRWMPPVGQHRAAGASLHARRQPHTITPVWHASSTHAAACAERRSLDALLVAATGPAPRTCFCCMLSAAALLSPLLACLLEIGFGHQPAQMHPQIGALILTPYYYCHAPPSALLDPLCLLMPPLLAWLWKPMWHC